MVFLCPQHQHALIPQAHDPGSNVELFRDIKAFRGEMFQLFQNRIEAFTATSTTDEPLEQYSQMRPVLDADPDIQATHKQRGVWQDRLWAKTLDDIEADRSRLAAVYHSHRQGKGSLELNPDLKIPSHQLKAKIHRMPGGYVDGLSEDGLDSGALYDHGVFLYGGGWFGPLNDELGYTIIHQVLAQHYPEFQPSRILDMGCSVGHSTLPYAAVYPQAQVWGIDLSASLLSYGLRRARTLDQTVYFAQQNVENTDFPDVSFDLVVSHILLHEIPAIARKRVFAESYRLLKPGGIMVHLESKLFLDPPSLVSRYFRDTEVWTNSEPYLGSSRFTDFPDYALAAGFTPETFNIHYATGHYAAQRGNGAAGWIAFCGVK
ncbi:MAG: methyltransferase domain-containing protein [Spirulina sp. SIO3F2]|nr:methyltransferase domain-containing protein [Spirulina sp. SIO3F2]